MESNGIETLERWTQLCSERVLLMIMLLLYLTGETEMCRCRYCMCRSKMLVSSSTLAHLQIYTYIIMCVYVIYKVISEMNISWLLETSVDNIGVCYYIVLSLYIDEC